jgi:hypothetical protein
MLPKNRIGITSQRGDVMDMASATVLTAPKVVKDEEIKLLDSSEKITNVDTSLKKQKRRN